MTFARYIATRIRDPVALAAACRRLGLPEPISGTKSLGSVSVSGWIVQLPGGHGPIVIDLATGQLGYDHTEGPSGDPQEMARLLQAYACEKARIEALGRGHSFSERTQPDGSILISIKPGGAS